MSSSTQRTHLESPETPSAAESSIRTDCLQCRIIGSAAFIGLGGYTFVSGRQQLREESFKQALEKGGSKFGLAVRRAGIHGISATLIGLGLYRLVM